MVEPSNGRKQPVELFLPEPPVTARPCANSPAPSQIPHQEEPETANDELVADSVLGSPSWLKPSNWKQSKTWSEPTYSEIFRQQCSNNENKCPRSIPEQ